MRKEPERNFGEELESEESEYGLSDEPNAVQIPITGTLDLHTFRPDEVRSLILEYLAVCLEEEIHQVRIVHGKGKGVLRRIVHSILEKHPAVISFGHQEGSGGSWGATIVRLKQEGQVRKK